MSTVKLAAESSLCQISVDLSLPSFRLYSAVSPGVLFVGCPSNLSFHGRAIKVAIA